jgi:hypothetical protein
LRDESKRFRFSNMAALTLSASSLSLSSSLWLSPRFLFLDDLLLRRSNTSFPSAPYVVLRTLETVISSAVAFLDFSSPATATTSDSANLAWMMYFSSTSSKWIARLRTCAAVAVLSHDIATSALRPEWVFPVFPESPLEKKRLMSLAPLAGSSVPNTISFHISTLVFTR